MLEPKEKAKELVDNFYQTTPNEAWINEPLGCTKNYKSWNQAKECLLIALDELIEFEKSIISQIENIAMLNGHKFKRERLYYESVKKEIEKS